MEASIFEVLLMKKITGVQLRKLDDVTYELQYGSETVTGEIDSLFVQEARYSPAITNYLRCSWHMANKPHLQSDEFRRTVNIVRAGMELATDRYFLIKVDPTNETRATYEFWFAKQQASLPEFSVTVDVEELEKDEEDWKTIMLSMPAFMRKGGFTKANGITQAVINAISNWSWTI